MLGYLDSTDAKSLLFAETVAGWDSQTTVASKTRLLKTIITSKKYLA